MIVVNHLWRRLAGGSLLPPRAAGAVSLLLTTACVVVAWVFFRAGSLEGAGTVLAGMFGLHGWGAGVTGGLDILGLLEAMALGGVGVTALDGNLLLLLAVAFVLVWGCPTSQQIVNYDPAEREPGLATRFPGATAVATGIALSFALLILARPSEFLYFQF